MAHAGEDERALAELQDRMLQGSQALARLTHQERARAGFKRQQELTLQELQSMPDDVRTYRAVGKAYFFSSKSDVSSQVDSAIKAAATELETVAAQRKIVEQKMKETENELRELVKSSPTIVRQMAAKA